jgi:hypothetical protein
VLLQVHALARGVGGDQDPQRVFRRWAVEAALDRLAALIADAAVEGGEARLGLVAAGDQLAHPPLQPVLGIGVLGEDQQAFAGPFRTRLPQAGAEMLADQLLQAPHPAVGLIVGRLRDLLHLAQQLPVLVAGLQRRTHRRFVLGIGLLQQLLLVPFRPLVVAIDGTGKKIKRLQPRRPAPAVLA